ncbi:MAG: family 20 glycosylhydrolase [SAR324 cluster bacterium]|nr:family 20 glycosylhydrolase [SAR324 cluster bacterium]
MLLTPHPRRLVMREGHACLSSGQIVIHDASPEMLYSAQLLQKDLEHFQGQYWPLCAAIPHHAPFLFRLRKTNIFRPSESYHLRIRSHEVFLEAPTARGIFYGIMTLRQLLRQFEHQLPCLEIEDFPDFPVRGVMLDVTRDKVPSLSTLFELVEQLAEWKINQLQLYFEHVFAYSGHRRVWCQASPYTGEDILKLDQFCREHFVELVPCQNSFGHLHRWLELPEYRHLAECPEGFQWPWGEFNPAPFSLCPEDPASMDFLAELYGELLPHFTSSLFNVGCDETFDLGQGRSKTACEQRGKGRVYLEFLQAIHQKITSMGRTMMFWGDIILEYPELVAELPKDVIVLEWGYEADHPFAEHGQKFNESGIPFYVCPGTSSWNSILGRTQNCMENLKNAVRNGLKHGANGVLITDWGDRGHWQPLPVSYAGYLMGAALSWHFESNEAVDICQALDLHAFYDKEGRMGQICHDLGNAYLHTGHILANNSAIFQWLFRDSKHGVFQKTTREHIQSTIQYLESYLHQITQTRMNRKDKTLIQQELTCALRMALHGCQRALYVLQNESDSLQKNFLYQDMREILGMFHQVWLGRNREGGLHDSTKILKQRLGEYAPYATQGSRIF